MALNLCIQFIDISTHRNIEQTPASVATIRSRIVSVLSVIYRPCSLTTEITLLTNQNIESSALSGCSGWRE
jgi:hypothetical protein